MEKRAPNLTFPQGGERAFRLLFEAYYPVVYQKILLIVLRSEDAEEIAHDLFLNLWQRRETLTRPESWQAYLTKAATYKAIDFIRQRRPKYLPTENLPQIYDPYYNADASLREADLFKRYLSALEALPPQCRLIFQLSRFEAQSYQQISAALGISPKTVENQIGKALKILRRWLVLALMVGG
jgi:RNA polymerase sigma-70 factor, ECF subfamily